LLHLRQHLHALTAATARFLKERALFLLCVVACACQASGLCAAAAKCPHGRGAGAA
jgi:hypothetical protein